MLPRSSAPASRKYSRPGSETGDVSEDKAADRLARASAGAGLSVAEPFTGRSNLYAEGDGLLVYDRARLDALNLTHEAATIAALEPFAVVSRAPDGGDHQDHTLFGARPRFWKRWCRSPRMAAR